MNILKIIYCELTCFLNKIYEKISEVSNENKSNLSDIIFLEYENDPKIKILKIFNGQNAVDKIQKLFFINESSNIAAKKWLEQLNWNTEMRNNAIFFIFLQISNNYNNESSNEQKIGFKFAIGLSESDNGSVLGELHNYEKGIKIMEKLIN